MSRYIIALLLACIACKSENKTGNFSDTNVIDTNVRDTSVIADYQNNPNVETKLILPYNVYYFSKTDVLDFLYLIDEEVCVINGQTCSYTYVPESKVLRIEANFDTRIEIQFYKFFSPSELENMASSNTTIENQSQPYQHVAFLEERGNNQWAVRSPVNLYTQNSLDDNDSEINLKINAAMQGEAKNILTHNFPQLENTMLQIENKLEFINESGLSEVTNLLNQKSQYNYEDIINKWELYSKQKIGIDKFVTGITLHHSNKEFRDISFFKNLFNKRMMVKNLEKDIDVLNDLLDNEVIPLVKNLNNQ